jgi:hypothetical protein
MWANIIDLRDRAGLVAGDTSKDAALNISAAAVVALAESYCDRKFSYQGELEEFIHKDGHIISLRRYPIEAIKAISGDNAPKYHLDKQNGLIHFDGHLHEHDLKVSYDGGYKDGEWPEDLLMAFWLLFDGVWGDYGATGGGGTVKAGEIESVTVQDLGTVRFATGAKAVVSSGAYGDFMTPTVSSILSNYRRESC